MNNTISKTDYVEIPLGSNKYPGLVALVDIEDYALVKGHKWTVVKTDCCFYAATNIKIGRNPTTYRTTTMHRLILGLKPGDNRQGDHKNHNGLDNRRSCNLRVATNQQNMQNQKPRGGTSRYKGVSWDKEKSKWQAKITKNWKAIHIGRFDTEVEAAIAYNEATLKYHGEFAYLNSIEDGAEIGNTTI